MNRFFRIYNFSIVTLCENINDEIEIVNPKWLNHINFIPQTEGCDLACIVTNGIYNISMIGNFVII